MNIVRMTTRRWLLGIGALLVLVAPAPAHAVRTWTVDIKAHPTTFKAGTEVDVPVYLVENRAPDQDPISYFTQFAPGIRYVSFDMGSTHSRFVSFTPLADFDARGREVPSAEGLETYENRIRNVSGRSRLYVQMMSTGGVRAMPDNSGITGRTELFIGTLRIAVGPAIPVTIDRRIVLDVVLRDDPTARSMVVDMWRRLPDADGDNYGFTSVGSMVTRQLRFFTDGPEDEEGIAPGDGSGSGTPTTPAGGPGAPAGPHAAPTGGSPGGPAGPGRPGGAGSAAGAGASSGGGAPAAAFSGRLRAARRASERPFTVLTKAPRKGTPVIAVELATPAKLSATLARVGKAGKAKTLAGRATVPKKARKLYLKLTGSWNRKRLAKGRYRMTLKPAGGTARTVTFTVR